MSQICDVDRLARLDPENNLIGIDGDRYEWMMNNVRHPDAIELFTLMRVESEKERAAMLRKATAHTAVTECALAATYEGADSSSDTASDASELGEGSFDQEFEHEDDDALMETQDAAVKPNDKSLGAE